MEISKALFRLDSCQEQQPKATCSKPKDNPGVTRDSNYVVRLSVSIVRNQLVSRFQLAMFWSTTLVFEGSDACNQLNAGAVGAVRMKPFPLNAIPSGKNSC